jgi:hypothetical protein
MVNVNHFRGYPFYSITELGGLAFLFLIYHDICKKKLVISMKLLEKKN